MEAGGDKIEFKKQNSNNKMYFFRLITPMYHLCARTLLSTSRSVQKKESGVSKVSWSLASDSDSSEDMARPTSRYHIITLH